MAFKATDCVQKELDIRGARNGVPNDCRAVIHYLEQCNCHLDECISEVVQPEDALAAMREWAADPGKFFRILVEF